MNVVGNVIYGVDFQAKKNPVQQMYETGIDVMLATWMNQLDYTVVINSIFADAIASTPADPA